MEHNDSEFRVLDILRYMLYVGFPAYYVFFLQVYIAMELWVSLANSNASASYCVGDNGLLFVIVGVFLIYLTPAYKTIVLESAVVLLCNRAAFEHEIDSDVVKVHRIRAPLSKRIFLWFFIVLPEFIVLLLVTFTGICYV